MNLNYKYDEGGLAEECKLSNKEEYEALLEYDLRREKEKNMILEERLRNKESFIQQMKSYQEEMTLTYEKCKEELAYAYQTISYFENVEVRDYHEQIAELKHIIMKGKSSTALESRRNSVSRDKNAKGERISKNRSEKNLLTHKGRSISPNRKNSSTLTPFGSKMSPSHEQISREFKGVANFVIHFLHMAKLHRKDLYEEKESLTKRLKGSWKWIKEIVHEWAELKAKALR